MSELLPSGGPAGGLVHGAGAASPAPADPIRVYAGGPEEDQVHLWDYWRVLMRHRWTVISVFLVTLITATVWTFTTRPVYTATAMLRIEKEEPRVLKFEEVVKADSQDDYYQTQYKILQSRSLANRVIGLLSLDQHPEFTAPEQGEGWLARSQTGLREQLVRWMPVAPPPAPDATDDLVPESPLTRTFQSRLQIQPVRNARLVNVSFDSHYPDLSARVANTLAEAFMAQNLDQKVGATRYASQFLAKQMEDARAKLEESEEKLNRFLGANDMLFVGPGSERAGEGQDLVTRQLAILSDALVRARTERIAKESTLAQGLGQTGESLPAVLQSPVVVKLKEQLTTLEGEQRQLAQTFKPEYPRMQRIEENLKELRGQLAGETRRIVEALDADYRAALRSEREIQKAVDEHRGLARRLGTQMAQYSLLRRDVDTNREIYTSLLTRLKETGVAAALLTSNISVVDRAEVPLSPSKPRKRQNLFLAAIVGLFGGVGLAFFFEYLDTSIKDAKEVEAILRVPTLGLVPSQESLETRRSRRRQLAAGEGAPAPFALVAQAEIGSILAEAFRNLRTSLLFSAPDHPPKSFMVTSLDPGDGKTSLATNLAIVLGQLGTGEVLLVDGDMRRPQLHHLLDVPQSPGLSTYLTGQAELDEVVKPTRIPNLFVIPSGQPPLNPAELMSSARLRRAVEGLGERFAHVVFDAPPLFGVSDSAVLAPQVEGVVLVLRHGRASRDAAQRAVGHLASMRARLLGVILNDVDVRAAGPGYPYYGYYGYYGYGPGGAGGRDGARVAGS